MKVDTPVDDDGCNDGTMQVDRQPAALVISSTIPADEGAPANLAPCSAIPGWRYSHQQYTTVSAMESICQTPCGGCIGRNDKTILRPIRAEMGPNFAAKCRITAMFGRRDGATTWLDSATIATQIQNVDISNCMVLY
jgi:hypothetical protein